MSRSGKIDKWFRFFYKVLIPLLVDVPLWAGRNSSHVYVTVVLIPLLVDDPLRVNLKSLPEGNSWVLIPLLVDDPLRVVGEGA